MTVGHIKTLHKNTE